MSDYTKAAALTLRRLLTFALAVELAGFFVLLTMFLCHAIGGAHTAMVYGCAVILTGLYCGALDDVRGVKPEPMGWDGTDNA